MYKARGEVCKMGPLILYTPLLSAILRHKYRPAPFDDLLLSVILVYLPLLLEGFSLREKPPLFGRKGAFLIAPHDACLLIAI